MRLQEELSQEKQKQMEIKRKIASSDNSEIVKKLKNEFQDFERKIENLNKRIHSLQEKIKNLLAEN